MAECNMKLEATFSPKFEKNEIFWSFEELYLCFCSQLTYFFSYLNLVGVE